MGVITAVPYNLWPFQGLVRVRKQPAAIIGPNANRTFRDLANTAKAIGMPRLAKLLAGAFRDDIRNGIAHADYVIWSDGLRLGATKILDTNGRIRDFEYQLRVTDMGSQTDRANFA